MYYVMLINDDDALIEVGKIVIGYNYILYLHVTWESIFIEVEIKKEKKTKNNF